MSRSRENADGARLDAPLASPAFSGTPTGIVAGSMVDGTITAAKVAADVATQAELDAQRTNSSITTLGTVTAGTLGSAVNLNHDAKKNSWHLYRSASVTYATATIVDFDYNVFIGSNVSESGGRITVTTAGLYLIMCTVSRQGGQTNALDMSLRVGGTAVSGTRLYSAGTPGVTYDGQSGAWAVPLNAGAIVDIYGNAYMYGSGTDSMSYFSGTRIGAIS